MKLNSHCGAVLRNIRELRHVTLHNVTVGDNCCIENIQNYIANYEIGSDTFIENVDIILVDGLTTFGNGVEVAVLNETGGREVLINDKLSAHQAYILALYRHRPELISRMKSIADYYSNKHASAVGSIGNHVMILNTGSIRNVRIGDYCHICGTCRLKKRILKIKKLSNKQINLPTKPKMNKKLFAEK